MTVSEQEQTLVQKARELTKFETKRAATAKELAAIDAEIVRVRGEIRALIKSPEAETAPV